MPALAFDFPLFRFQEAPLRSAHRPKMGWRCDRSLADNHSVTPQLPGLPGFRGGYPEYPAQRRVSSGWLTTSCGRGLEASRSTLSSPGDLGHHLPAILDSSPRGAGEPRPARPLRHPHLRPQPARRHSAALGDPAHPASRHLGRSRPTGGPSWATSVAPPAGQPAPSPPSPLARRRPRMRSHRGWSLPRSATAGRRPPRSPPDRWRAGDRAQARRRRPTTPSRPRPTRSAPSKLRSIPRAWHSRPGPRHRSRSSWWRWSRQRAWRIRSRPSIGSRARSSTAWG